MLAFTGNEFFENFYMKLSIYKKNFLFLDTYCFTNLINFLNRAFSVQSKVCEHNDTQVKETDLSEENFFGKSKLEKDALNDASIKKGNLIPKSNFREGFTNK